MRRACRFGAQCLDESVQARILRRMGSVLDEVLERANQHGDHRLGRAPGALR